MIMKRNIFAKHIRITFVFLVLLAGCASQGARNIMNHNPEIDSLIAEMKSGDENNLISASVMLGQYGHEAVEPLIELLKDYRHLVRDYSAMSLGIIGADAKDAVPALLTVLRDENSSVRYAATVALGKIGVNSIEVIEGLRTATSDSDAMVVRGAKNALEELKKR
jgi:HEAT repeat protein